MCLECVWRILNVSGMGLENFEYVLNVSRASLMCLEPFESFLDVSGVS